MRTRGETSSGRDGRAQKQKLAGAMLAVRLLGRSLTRNKFRTTMDQIRTQQNEVKQKQIENFHWRQNSERGWCSGV